MRVRASLFAFFLLVFFATAFAQQPPAKGLECIITVDHSVWKTPEDTVIHVRLLNHRSTAADLRFDAILLMAPDEDAFMNSIWAPIDLAHDAPVATQPSGIAHNMVKQSLRIEANSEKDFTLHATNMKWEHRASSTWPAQDLFKLASPVRYDLVLALTMADSNLESKRVSVTLAAR